MNGLFFSCLLKKPNNNKSWLSFYLKKAIMQWIYISEVQMSEPKFPESYKLIS